MSNVQSHAREQQKLAPALRILCLHDAGSNAGRLSDELEVLGERLYENHMIDLVYVNSPLLMVRESESSPGAASTSSTSKEDPDREWWEDQGEESKYVGLDASLLLLRQVWTSMPFWGILAVGQGAAAAAFLPLLPMESVPAFAIFVHGESLLEEQERLIDDLTCLHVLGSNPTPSSERLLQQFGGTVHPGGKRFTNKTLNAIGKFIVSQKKELRSSDGGGNVLALQNQLYWAEQEVAHAVAERIAMDPPKALMAIVSPQNVGGWSGRKRRGPEEEGGGAPCPSDFLLHREQRTTDPQQGPTREHPSQQQQQQASKEEVAETEEKEDVG